MEVDTGAAVSLISLSKLRALFPDMPITKSKVVLTTYTGECMDVRGGIEMDVQYGE